MFNNIGSENDVKALSLKGSLSTFPSTGGAISGCVAL